MNVQDAEVLANAMPDPLRDDSFDIVEVHAGGTRQVGDRGGPLPVDFLVGTNPKTSESKPVTIAEESMAQSDGQKWLCAGGDVRLSGS